MSKPTRAEALSIVRELVIDAVQRHRPIVVAKTFAHRWTVDAILAAISEPEPLSEDDIDCGVCDRQHAAGVDHCDRCISPMDGNVASSGDHCFDCVRALLAERDLLLAVVDDVRSRRGGWAFAETIAKVDAYDAWKLTRTRADGDGKR
jgi:hypothetical protein